MNQPRRQKRTYRFRSGRRGRLFALLLGAALVLFGGVSLARYGADYLAARKTARELKEAYAAAPPIAPSSTPAPTKAPAPTDTAPPEASPRAAAPTDAPTLSPIGYPKNSTLKISNRFKHLRLQGKYIVGWLTVPGLLDEPVAQRDNTFFLDHDAKGQKNQNGALFLDASVSLNSRPYTLMIYGHNMKTGAMFGGLRNYEKLSFYHANPFVTFDTMYEEGRYAVFSIGTVSLLRHGRHYVDFSALRSDRVQARQAAVDALIAASEFTCPVDVRAEDQLLLLITCVEKDEERRVVAARRVRDGEDEGELKKLAERSRKK